MKKFFAIVAMVAACSFGATSPLMAQDEEAAAPETTAVSEDTTAVDTAAAEPAPAPAEITTAPAEKTQDGTGLTKVCSECGTVLNENAKFCKGCGKPV